jgi:hypothetical protein
MARELLVSVVCVLSFVSPALAATELKMAMGRGCSPNDAVLRIARNETARIWSRAGVEVRWEATDDLPYRAPWPAWVVVQCVANHSSLGAEVGPIPIAAIRFIDARPTNSILLSVRNAEMLIERDSIDSRVMALRYRGLKQLRLGRMLGRAIAHEVGHFLSASGTHTPTGLMRAVHPVADLIGESLHPFRIDEPVFPVAIRTASEVDDGHSFVPRIETDGADRGRLAEIGVQGGTNAAAAAAVNEPQFRDVSEERVVQGTLRPCQRVLDGETVEINVRRPSR